MDNDFEDSMNLDIIKYDNLPLNDKIFTEKKYNPPLSTNHTCITGPSWSEERGINRYNEINIYELTTGYYHESPDIYRASKYCNVPGENNFDCFIDGRVRSLGFTLETVPFSYDGPYFTSSEDNKREKCIHSYSPAPKDLLDDDTDLNLRKLAYIGLAKDHPETVHHEAAVNVAERATLAYTQHIIDEVVRLSGGSKDIYIDWAILRFLGYQVKINSNTCDTSSSPCGCPSPGNLPPLCCENDTSGSCGNQSGDPHFTTFDGLAYDFQGVGEFILVKSLVPEDTFEVQSRYCPWGNSKGVSVTKAVAMKIDQDKVGYYLGMDPPLVVNRTPTKLESGNSITLPSGGSIVRAGTIYRFSTTDGNIVETSDRGAHMSVTVRISASKYGKVMGLLGNADQNTENDVTIRDGNVLGTNPHFDDLYPGYADSWRITQEQSLFHDANGETTETCTERNFPRIQTTTANLPENYRVKAEQICRAAGITNPILLDNCILDFALTGDISFVDIPNNAVIPTKTVEVVPPPPPTINDSGFGQFTGSVIDAVTSQNLNHGQATLTIDGNPISGNNLHLITNGIYETTVVPTDTKYHLDIEANGYISEQIFGLYAPDRQKYQVEQVKLIPVTNSGQGVISGHIHNALNNNPVPNLNINVRRYINKLSGTSIKTTTTDQNGAFTFNDLEAGNYTLEIKGNGYNTNHLTAVNIGGQTNQVNGVVKPESTNNSQFTIVLTWGERPSDLDAHLTVPNEQGGQRFHIYHATLGNEHLKRIAHAHIDHDKQDSFGPETITIGKLLSGGVYRYSVHDYSNSPSTFSQALGQSGAKVEVYGDGNRLIYTLNVPPQEGTLWTVFEINESGHVEPINDMSYESVIRSARIGTRAHDKKPIVTDYWQMLFLPKKK
jgi:hypothetical protein